MSSSLEHKKILVKYRNILRYHRSKSNLSRPVLANITGVHQNLISKFETGQSGIGLNNYLNLIDRLDLKAFVFDCRTGASKMEDNMDYNHHINCLCFYRKERGLSRKSLAEKTGLSSITIYNMEKKRTSVSLETYLRVMDALETKMLLVDKDSYSA